MLNIIPTIAVIIFICYTGYNNIMVYPHKSPGGNLTIFQESCRNLTSFCKQCKPKSIVSIAFIVSSSSVTKKKGIVSTDSTLNIVS